MPTIDTGDATMPESPEGLEQRKQQRYICVDGGLMRLSVRPEFRGRRAMLVDLSTGGIGFLVEEALETGAMMVFELQGPGDTGPLTRLARVRHCRAHPTPLDAPWAAKTPVLSNFFRGLLGIQTAKTVATSWLIGCQFEKPLDQADLQHFLDRLKTVQEFGEL